MKAVHKTLAVLVYWSAAAVAYGSDGCMHGDIRLTDNVNSDSNVMDILEVCIEGSWTSVCHTGGWHSTLSSTENTRVACRQLGYSEEGATFAAIVANIPTTATGLRQGMCSGSERQLIDCPAIGGTAQCADGVTLTCQPATCDTTIRLRGGSTATGGRVEVCRDGQWGTVCDDFWDKNDARVACRQLGLSNFISVAISSAYFGPGSGRIHLSNLQCTGSEATLADCIFNTQHQCSHYQDASVICLNLVDCSNEDILIYTSDTNTVEFCNGKMCNEACQEENRVYQLGAYFCGSGEITHFLMSGSQLYECPISGVGEFLICKPTAQTLANNCQQVLQDIELQASSSSIIVTWDNAANAQNLDSSYTYEIICRVENSNQQVFIVVDAVTSEVTVENLPHSTRYECCVTLHIGRYSTRACGNTTTLAGTTITGGEAATGGGAVIALGVVVAVLVLLLVLVTGACLYLLILKVNNNSNYPSQSSTNKPQEYQYENPTYNNHSVSALPPSSSTPHTLTPPFSTEEAELAEYSVVENTSKPDLNYEILKERPAKKTAKTAKKPNEVAPLPVREGSTEEGVDGAVYSALNRPETGLVYAVVDKKAKKKTKDRIEPAYEAANGLEEYSHLQH